MRTELGVRVDFQNVFMWDKAATVERFLGRALADRAVPTRTLIDKLGLDSLGAGTDFPVNPINPFLNMYIMVTRKDPNGNVYGASEAITREQALRLYTSAASHYTFEEAQEGHDRARQAGGSGGALGRLHDRAGRPDQGHQGRP